MYQVFFFRIKYYTEVKFSDFRFAKYTVTGISQKEVLKLAYCKYRVLFLAFFFRFFFRIKLAHCKGFFIFSKLTLHAISLTGNFFEKTGVLQIPCSIFFIFSQKKPTFSRFFPDFFSDKTGTLQGVFHFFKTHITRNQSHW